MSYFSIITSPTVKPLFRNFYLSYSSFCNRSSYSGREGVGSVQVVDPTFSSHGVREPFFGWGCRYRTTGGDVNSVFLVRVIQERGKEGNENSERCSSGLTGPLRGGKFEGRVIYGGVVAPEGNGGNFKVKEDIQG